MTKILIAQMFYGRGCMSSNGDESKATFTMEEVEASLAAASKEHGENITLENAEDEDFFDVPALAKLFAPNFEEGFAAALKKVLAGEQVFCEDEETLHGMALDTGDESRKALMAEVRKRWIVVDETNDEDGWD